MHDISNSYRRKKLKIQKQRFIRRRLIILFIFIALSLFVSNKIYRKIKCRDLQYAVEYQLTSGNSSEKLLRVQRITLVYNDTQKAVVRVFGLSKNKPHKETTIQSTFKKDSLNSWNLESTINSQYTN